MGIVPPVGSQDQSVGQLEPVVFHGGTVMRDVTVHTIFWAPAGYAFGKPAYHALTYGWLMSGLARAVTGKGMRELIREELAEPLDTDGLHLGRPPAESPTRPAQIIMPQSAIANPLFNAVAPKIAALLTKSLLSSVSK